MAVTNADLLVAALPPRLTFSPTNQSAAPTATDNGTPASASFQNVLAAVQTTTPTTATTTTTATTDPTQTGLLTDTTGASLSTTDDATLLQNLLDATDDQDQTAATDTSALGLLLAAVTTGLQTPTPDAVPTATAGTAALTTDLATAQATTNDLDVRTRADQLRLAQSPNRPAATPPLTTNATATQAAATATRTQTATQTQTATAQTVAQVAAAPIPTTATTAATPADTARAAARPLSVVAQAPLVVDPNQVLPSGLPGVATQPVFPAVGATDPVQPAPAVTPGQPLSVALELRANFAAQQPPAPTPPTAATTTAPFAAVLQQQEPTVAPAPTTAAVQPTVAAAPTAAVVQQPAVAATTVTPNAVPPVAPEATPVPSTVAAATGTPKAVPPAAIPTTPTATAEQPALATATPVQPTAAGSTVLPNAVLPVAAPAVEALPVDVRPPVEVVPAVSAVPTAVPAPNGTVAPIRGAFRDAAPVDSTDKAGPTAATSTPVAGLVPQAVDARPAPSPNAPSAVHTPSPAAQLGDSIVTHASLAERDGKVEFQLRLDPPELGPVKIKLLAHGDKMSAEVVVSSDAVRKMVESQLPDLRQRLADAGLNLPNLDVSTGSGQQGRGDAGDWDQQNFGGFRQVAGTAQPARRPTATAVGANGSLDVMV